MVALARAVRLRMQDRLLHQDVHVKLHPRVEVLHGRPEAVDLPEVHAEQANWSSQTPIQKPSSRHQTRDLDHQDPRHHPQEPGQRGHQRNVECGSLPIDRG